MSRRVTVVRCPRCGSTAAGEVGGTYNFTEMNCASCGHNELCDEFQIRDDWNLDVTLAEDGSALPSWYPPKF